MQAAVRRGEFGHGYDRAQALDLRLDQLREPPGLGHGDQHPGAAIVQDAALAPQVVLELRRTQRRVDRHRHAAGEEHAEEAVKVIGRRRQHQRDRLAGAETLLLQAARDRDRALPEFAVGDDFALPVVLVELDVGPIRMLVGVPVEHVDQRLRAGRRDLDPAEPEFAGAIRREHPPLIAALPERPQQVPRRLGLGEDFLVERDPEFLFDAGNQLDQAETVEPGIVAQRIVEPEGPRFRAPRMEFERDRLDQVEQSGLDRVVGVAPLLSLHRASTIGCCRQGISYGICRATGATLAE